MSLYYSDEFVTIWHGDAFEVAPGLPRTAMALTDPPYHVGIKYASYADRPTDTRSYGASVVAMARMASNLVVLTPGTVNFWHWPEPDGVVIRYDRTQQSPGRIAHLCKWEPVLVYGKPPQKLAWDVIETYSQSERMSERVDHPVIKPLSLLRTLIRQWSEPDDVIFDPFMGSGSTLVAAKSLNRRSVGIEISERYCEVAAQRCSQEVLGLVS